MPDHLITSLTSDLDELSALSLRRELLPLERTGPARVRLGDGREALLLCGNDYLGLSMHERLIDAVKEGAERFGVGAGASRLVSGSHAAHHAAEAALAQWKGAEAALLIGSGYLANLAIIGALTQKGDAVLCDRLNHASLIDGARLSGADLIPYHHADAAHAGHLLQQRRARYRRVVIATDSIFSMDGDAAPLGDLLALAEQFDAFLLADEAHALGVMGARGRGMVEALVLPANHPRLIQMGTLSKAAGLYGAYAAAARPVIELIVNRGRAFIYSTAPPPALAHAIPVALRLIDEAGPERERLRTMGRELFEGLRAQGWNIAWHGTPILPLLAGGEMKATALQARLLEAGILAVAIRPPSVPRGSSRLRLSLSAALTGDDVKWVIGRMRDIGQAEML